MWLQLVIEVVVTYSDFVCYLFMIVSMMKNAGLIAVIYPFVVFGYALMEEINPRKRVWYAIMVYTEFLILIKFLYQLSFWEAIFWDNELDHFQDLLNAAHIGLHRKASGAFGELLAYFLPEILILFAIMSHIQKEIMVGLLYHKEERIEDIKEALIRHMNNANNEDLLLQRVHTNKSMMTQELDLFNLKFYKDIRNFEAQNELMMRRHSFSSYERQKYSTYE